LEPFQYNYFFTQAKQSILLWTSSKSTQCLFHTRIAIPLAKLIQLIIDSYIYCKVYVKSELVNYLYGYCTSTIPEASPNFCRVCTDYSLELGDAPCPNSSLQSTVLYKYFISIHTNHPSALLCNGQYVCHIYPVLYFTRIHTPSNIRVLR
jgi:hypothetical protein